MAIQLYAGTQNLNFHMNIHRYVCVLLKVAFVNLSKTIKSQFFSQGNCAVMVYSIKRLLDNIHFSNILEIIENHIENLMVIIKINEEE